MTKLCPRGKAAAKRKFRVYPSAYANAYASRICAGKIKDPSGVKRKDFTFKTKTGKTESNKEAYNRIMKQNKKVIGNIVKDAFKEKKATGGRVGRRLGGGMNMSRRKTNVEKIKEAFSTKKNKNLKPVDKKKNPGLAKLPIEVRNKMGYAKKGGRA